MDTYTCWHYAGYIVKNSGYGRISGELAHRVFWREARGPVPEGLVLDHLCRNRRCVNPEHLEPVTLGENIRRGISANGSKTSCSNGHKFTPSNTFNYVYRGVKRRRCRICHRVRTKEHVRQHRIRKNMLGAADKS